MKKVLTGLALCLPLAASAVEGKVIGMLVSDKAALKPGQSVRIAMDGGKLTVAASESAELAYQVKFVPSSSGFFGKKPLTPEEYAGCSAAYDPKTGELAIRTSKGANAEAEVSLPAKQQLQVKLGGGKAVIGPRSGLVEAEVGGGLLEYDASGLAKGACVEATVKAGAAYNNRDANCTGVGAKLHVGKGAVKVK